MHNVCAHPDALTWRSTWKVIRRAPSQGRPDAHGCCSFHSGHRTGAFSRGPDPTLGGTAHSLHLNQRSPTPGPQCGPWPAGTGHAAEGEWSLICICSRPQRWPQLCLSSSSIRCSQDPGPWCHKGWGPLLPRAQIESGQNKPREASTQLTREEREKLRSDTHTRNNRGCQGLSARGKPRHLLLQSPRDQHAAFVCETQRNGF